MQGSHAKSFRGLSFCLILSIFVNVLTSCNNGNSQATVVQETELISIQLTATEELTLVPEKKVVIRPTLTPEPTATPLIQGDIFFDPQSKEDFKDVALAPSPIDEPEKFALWHEEYLKQINEKLKNYNGPTVELTKTRYNGEYGIIGYVSEKWPVAGSYLFKWQGEAVLNKTYIFDKKSDGDGYVLLNTTYYPESIMKDKSYEYNYGTVKNALSIIYTLTDYVKNGWFNAFDTDFFNTYVRTEEQMDAFERVIFNKAEEGDEVVFSQMQFICTYSR